MYSASAETEQCIVVQNCGERCWAASISFIFGYHGHPTHQDRISAVTFGPGSVAACIPAGSSKTLVKVLDSDWRDDNGNLFHARISAAYDPANGVVSMDNSKVVAELAAGNPLLYCNTVHAMVQMGMQFIADPSGRVLRIDDVQVVDPWPNIGYRSLRPAERVPRPAGGEMTFLAAVTIS